MKSAYVATITHEVGHAVDYSRNLQSASSGYLTTTDKNLKKELANFLKVLSESESEYNSENTYALKNSLELFAEYYTYTYASDPLTSKGFFPYLESKKCPKILREAWQKLKVQFDEIIANNNK